MNAQVNKQQEQRAPAFKTLMRVTTSSSSHSNNDKQCEGDERSSKQTARTKGTRFQNFDACKQNFANRVHSYAFVLVSYTFS